MLVLFDYLIISIFIILNLLITPYFSPTWDFPFHLEQGMVRLGEIQPRSDFFWNAYGWFTNMAPYLFSKLFPTSWFPWSYFVFGVLMGSAAVVCWYLFVKDVWGRRVAILTSTTIFLLPRFIGHLHTNTKDLPMTAFFIISIYFFHRFLKQLYWWEWSVSLLFFIFSVNTKISVLQLFPVLFVWTTYVFWKTYWHSKKRQTMGLLYSMCLVPFIILPLAIFALLWPGTIQSFFDSLHYTTEELKRHPSQSPFYALIQFVTTTPLPVLMGSCVGLYVLVQQVIKKKSSEALFIVVLYLYAFLKYPLFHQPIIDDIRYFLEILFPLSLSFVIGVEHLCKRYAIYVFALIIVFCGYLVVSYHPYEIAYNNILATNPDSDFWGASYQEVFQYINTTVPKGTVVSARLAPQLAYMLIRPDLRETFNTKPPEESDIVVILNRPSFFPLFQVDSYFSTHTPQKIISTRSGVPLSYIYYK